MQHTLQTVVVALSLLLAWRAEASYDDLGRGKCKMEDGQDPVNSFHEGRGDVCEQMCDESSECHGFSVSNYSNCLLWEEQGLLGGGVEWSGAHCYVQQDTHVSARNAEQEQCKCTDGNCGWDPAPSCVEQFEYEGEPFHGCTTVDNGGVGWCSNTALYMDDDWSHCQLRCPEGCYWRGRLGCKPAPVNEEPSWKAPEECVPEYWYKGKLYTGCTSADADPGEGAWCSRHYRYHTKQAWGTCTPCCTAHAVSGLPGAFGVSALFGVLGMLCTGMPAMLLLRRRICSSRDMGSWALRGFSDNCAVDDCAVE